VIFELKPAPNTDCERKFSPLHFHGHSVIFELKPAPNTDCERKFSPLHFRGYSVIFELKLPFVDFNEYLRYLPFTDIIIFLKLKQRSLWNVSEALEYCVFPPPPIRWALYLKFLCLCRYEPIIESRPIV
jgi:hypothetical protein